MEPLHALAPENCATALQTLTLAPRSGTTRRSAIPACRKCLAQLGGALGEVPPALEVHGHDGAGAEDLRGLRRGVGAESVR